MLALRHRVKMPGVAAWPVMAVVVKNVTFRNWADQRSVNDAVNVVLVPFKRDTAVAEIVAGV